MTARESRRRIRLERTYPASLKTVWEMWTTAEGLESWWGPDGFEVKVHSIDVRPGGILEYSMAAVAPEPIAFLKRAGRPSSSDHRATYVEVSREKRLTYDHLVDFIPGVPTYDTRHEIDFSKVPGGVRILVSLEVMHDDEMTRMAEMGWSSELDRLGRLLAAGS